MTDKEAKILESNMALDDSIEIKKKIYKAIKNNTTHKYDNFLTMFGI